MVVLTADVVFQFFIKKLKATPHQSSTRPQYQTKGNRHHASEPNTNQRRSKNPCPYYTSKRNAQRRGRHNYSHTSVWCLFQQQCWRSRSRSPSQRSMFTSICNRDRQDRDLDLDLRSIPNRSNNAGVGCCVCKFRCYITEYCCIVCVIAAMCNIQCRALCCVVAGTTALLSVLLFSCEVSAVKYAACMSGYLEAVLVWGIPCLLHVVRCV